MEFDLKKNTILLSVAGSHCYGMATPKSDIDIMGVCSPPKEYYLGFSKKFEQADKASHMQPFIDLLKPEYKQRALETKLEGSIYDLRKYLTLAADCNPNCLNILFCEDEDVILSTSVGNKLRANRDLFLSKKCRFTYWGYAFSQMRRISSHRGWLLNPAVEPKRIDFDLPEKSEIPKNQLAAVEAAVQKQLDKWDSDVTSEEEISNSVKMRIRENVAQLLRELKISSLERFNAATTSMGFDTNFIHYLQKEREYKTAQDNWHSYCQWKKTRNEERAVLEANYGYDLKHAAHIYRLVLMCEEMLSSGKLIVKRPDAEQILNIRNGGWKYEQLVEWFEAKETSINELFKTSKVLPESSNIKKINQLCVELVEEQLSSV